MGLNQSQNQGISAEKHDFDNQSIEIDENEHIRVCSSNKGKPLTEYRFKDVKTLYDVLPKGLSISYYKTFNAFYPSKADGPCLGQREELGLGPYKWITYSEVLENVKYVGSAMIHKGIESRNSTNIGIYSSNRCEWIITEHACYSFSLTVVSLYDSYGKESIKYILNHAEIKAIFLDNFKRLKNILDVVHELPNLKFIVHFDPLSPEENAKVDEFRGKIEIIYFEEFLEIGIVNEHEPKPPKPENIATICYTSGTTGIPKGAIISHANIIANEAAIYERLNQPQFNYFRDSPRVVHMSYLPLAHMLERQASIMVFLGGGQLGFSSGDITKLADDIQTLKPTDFPVVPRLLNKMYNQIKNQINGNMVKEYLFRNSIAAKEYDIKRGIYNKSTIYDWMVFNRVREKFGGNIIRMASGSAPVSDEVMIFARAAFGCPIPEGYGQTEATSGITCSHPFDPQLGHCGPPISSYMVKLIDVPEMDYYSKNNQGEICAKGPSRFQGYLKDEEKTAEVIDKDGWLHTGDIGMWLPNGTLKIIDRKKNLFKLSQGEYISPEKIENIYQRSPFVTQIYIDGDSLKDHIVAIVVPDAEYLTSYCKKNEINGNLSTLCKNKEVRKIVLNDLIKYGKMAGLMSYEQVKNIYLNPEVMSLQNGLATPTMKIKRLEVRKKFKDIIDELYSEETMI